MSWRYGFGELRKLGTRMIMIDINIRKNTTNVPIIRKNKKIRNRHAINWLK